MRKFLNPEVHTVFLMLGPRCNLRCRYCLQQPLRADREPEDVSPDVIACLQDLAANQATPLTVHFYGGEPLMYREHMKAAVAALAETPNIRFSLISNGTLMDRETVDWLNRFDFQCAVSWDGPNSLQTRGVNVFDDPERRARILDLKHLMVSSVISAYSYPRETLDALPDLDREHEERTGENLFVHFDEIMDTGLRDRSLLAVDLDRVRDDMRAVADETGKMLAGEPCNPWYGNLGQQYLGRLKQGIDGRTSFRRGACACGNGYDVLNMDVRGRLYRCHNTDTVLGTIHDAYSRYLSDIILHDPTRDRSAECEHCSVVSLCDCGCPLIEPDVRAAGYCDLKRAVFEPFVELVASLGSGGE